MVEDIEDELMQKIRYLDKLVDELAKGRATGQTHLKLVIIRCLLSEK